MLMPQIEKLTPGGSAYVNEADVNQAGWQQVFYGSNYDRLRAIKQKYDSRHLFYSRKGVVSEYCVEKEDGRLCRFWP